MLRHPLLISFLTCLTGFVSVDDQTLISAVMGVYLKLKKGDLNMTRQRKTSEFLRTCIFEALMLLLDQKKYEDITISELAEKAGVGQFQLSHFCRKRLEAEKNCLQQESADSQKLNFGRVPYSFSPEDSRNSDS